MFSSPHCRNLEYVSEPAFLSILLSVGFGTNERAYLGQLPFWQINKKRLALLPKALQLSGKGTVIVLSAESKSQSKMSWTGDQGQSRLGGSPPRKAVHILEDGKVILFWFKHLLYPPFYTQYTPVDCLPLGWSPQNPDPQTYHITERPSWVFIHCCFLKWYHPVCCMFTTYNTMIL